MTTPHCNINLIWANFDCREALFEKLLPRTKLFSLTTELDDGVQWLADDHRDAWSVNVYCADVTSGLNSIERILLLQRTRGLKYVAVLTKNLSQDVYHEWYDKLQASLPEGAKIRVFDPIVGGAHYDTLVKEIEDELREHATGSLRAAASMRPADEEGHW